MPWSFSCSYPGISSVYSLTYTASIGITPGVVSILCHPADTPAAGGSLTFGVTDGATTNTITLAGCLLDMVSGTADSSNRTLLVKLYDRRWKWRDSFPVDGSLNERDDHEKLIPWKIRSPYQIAVYLLTRMGEPTPGGGWQSVIDLPGGLAQPAGGGFPAPASYDLLVNPAADYLKAGDNYSRSRTNQPVRWVATPAAVALADLCETYGRCVVFDPLTDSVSIQKLGSGTALPAGRLLSTGPSVTLGGVPSAVTAMGSPVRFQGRFRFRAVVQDWDKSWVSPDRATYAPLLPTPGRAMVGRARVVDYNPITDYTLVVNGVRFTAAVGTHASALDVHTVIANALNASANPRIAGKLTAGALTVGVALNGVANGYEFKFRAEPAAMWKLTCPVGPLPGPSAQYDEWNVQFSAPSWSASNTLSVTVNGTTYSSGTGLSFGKAVEAVADAVNAANTANPVANPYTAGSAGGGYVLVAGTALGAALTVTAAITGTGSSVSVTRSRSAAAAAYGFQYTNPLAAANVAATDRLSYHEALALAESTYCRTFQLVAEDPADPDTKAVTVPSLPPITNRFLVKLLGSRVEQVVPRPRDVTAIDTRTNESVAADVYNGYSQDRKPDVFASISTAAFGGIVYPVEGGVGPNTVETQRVYADVEVVDPLRQVIRFGQPLFRILGEGNNAVILPSEPVVEIGVNVHDAATGAPVRYGVTVTIAGGTAPPVTRTFPDVQQEVVGEYDADHNPTGYRLNDTDPAFRATTYATETALGYQRPTAQTVQYNTMAPVTLSGLVRQVEWKFGAGGFSTTAGANAEFSPVVPPYGERRRQEALPPDAQRAQENLATAKFVELPKNAGR